MKKLLCLISSIILAASACCPTYADNVSQIIGSGNTVNFYDVPNDYWARDQILYFSSMGIVNGYEDGSFRPEDGVTREEFCKLLVSTFKPAISAPDAPSFSDVDPLRWSYPYVEVCKDFMTGYNNPFGGLPAFHPEDYAVREDIAVALVRMMGYTDKDAENPNYALYKFGDGALISPALMPYVSIACEKNLISGYPDGTFGPSSGITRAETVVMLNRATKQAVTNIEAELELTAGVTYEDDGKTAVITAYSEEGADLFISGDGIAETNMGKEVGTYKYNFESEGERPFVVTAKKGAKTKTVPVTAKYVVGAPVLNITQCPTSSDTTSVTIKGNVKDEKDQYPDVTVNGKSVNVSYSGDWSTTVNLTEGTNTIIVTATNDSGKSTTETKTVEFGVGAPVLTITQCPATSSTTSVTIKGNVKDTNDQYPDLTVNGKSVNVSYSGDWSTTVNLTEGKNTITFIATNDLGKTTTDTRTIEFGVGAPVLTITQCPATSSTTSVTIRGNVKDTNDQYPDLTVNGKSVNVSYNGDWSATVNLKEGTNTITFIAVNDLGKTTTETRTIEFGVGAPVLTITQCPATSSTTSVTIRGNVKDTNDQYPDLTVNGKSVNVSYNGDWSTTVNLNEGTNTITFIAANDLGKTTTETRTIEFGVSAPVITITQCPSDSDTDKLTVRGNVKDTNDQYPDLTVNGKSVNVSYNGDWSTTVNLNEGTNTITFVAVNDLGKTTTETRTVTFKAGSPQITFTNCPNSTKQQNLSIQGRIKGDITGIKLYINDSEVSVSSYDGSFSKSVYLDEGENVFEFRAVNYYGNTDEVVKIIEYSAE